MKKIFFALTFVALSLHAEGTKLYLYNWADYMTDEVLEIFKNETGIEVVQDYFASNEELIAKLQAGSFAYDVAIPSDYYVHQLIDQDLIIKLDHTLIPNRKNLFPHFLNPTYDANNAYSMPYFWGTTGIAYDSNKIKDPITSWQDLFNPKFKRKINTFDDMREVIGSALHVQGASVNTQKKEELEKTRELLKSQKKLLRTYNSSMYRDILSRGDVWISMSYSGDAAKTKKEYPHILFINPKEGGTIYTDNLVIPKFSKNVKEAHAFINFLLRPDIGEKLALAFMFASPNQEVLKRLPEKIRNDPAVYPPQEVLSKLEYIVDVGQTLKTYEDIWIDLKTY